MMRSSEQGWAGHDDEDDDSDGLIDAQLTLINWDSGDNYYSDVAVLITWLVREVIKYLCLY